MLFIEQEIDASSRDDLDFDSIAVETADEKTLGLLLPLLRISAKLADFSVTQNEALLLCDALRGRDYLEEPPALLAEAIAGDLEEAENEANRIRVDRFELAASIRKLNAAEAYLLYAATVLFWAARSRYSQVAPQDFLRVHKEASALRFTPVP